METKVELNLFRALSPLHVGSGSAIGVVDLPIQREQHTSFPKVESSSLKGAIRDAVYQKEKNTELFKKVFGNNPDDRNLIQTGAVTISEARILLFPVQSLKGVFTFVTSPFVLNRFIQEQNAYFDGKAPLDFPSVTIQDNRCLVSNKALLTQQQIVLQEYTFAAEESSPAKVIAAALDDAMQLEGYLKDRLAIIPDDEFSQFVQLSTEITTRIRINPETGVTQDGALFYEENVPSESVFYSIFYYKDTKETASEKKITLALKADEVQQFVNASLPGVLQLGGNSTIGRGMMKRNSIAGGESL